MNEELNPRQAEILAYLCGEMNEAARARFAARLRREPELRAELEASEATLEAARQWFDSPAPGAERALALPVPSLKDNLHRLPVPVWTRRLRRAAGLAAVFVVGFALGYVAQTAPIIPPPNIPVVETTHPQPTPEERQARRVRYARQENGRVVVSLDNSTWVVDGGFQLASPAIENGSRERM